MVEVSPISSRASSPDSHRRSSRQDSISSAVSGENGFSTPQTVFLQKTKELREQQPLTSSSLGCQQEVTQVQNTTIYSADKPPIPPRGLPPPIPQRQISTSDCVQLRNRSGNVTTIVLLFMIVRIKLSIQEKIS